MLHPNIRHFTKHLPLNVFDKVDVDDTWMEYVQHDHGATLRTLSEDDLNSVMLNRLNSIATYDALFYLNMKTGGIFKPFVNGVGLKHLSHAGEYLDSSDDRPKPAIGQNSDCRPW